MRLLALSLSKILTGVLLLGFVAVGCDDDDENISQVSATASGAEEVPAVTTPATGTLTGNLNRDTRMLTYTLTWNNLKDSATMAHFHGPASRGQNAGVLIPIFMDRRAVSGSISGSTTLADTTMQHFINGRIYVNVHSKVHGPGEIRGQVSVQ